MNVERRTSINKIHINSTTNLSLNERFTVMQSIKPRVTTPTRRIAPRRRTQNASKLLDKASTEVSLANRKLLELLDKKHKMQAALKLKRKSMKPILPNRQRVKNRIGLRKGAAANAIRLTPSGRLSRSNSLTNIATMKADFVQTGALRRSNSTSSLAGRLGVRRASTGSAPSGPRRRLKRNNLVRASSKQNLTRSNSTTSLNRPNPRLNQRRSNSRLSLKRSNSRASLRRSNSRSNLKRSNSKTTLGRASGSQGSPQKRIAPSQRRRSNSVSSRLGVKKMPMARDRIRAANIRGGIRRGRGRGQGRAQVSRRRNSTVANHSNLGNSGGDRRQSRISRPRGRENENVQRGKSRSRSRGRMVVRQQNRNGNRGNRSVSRGRGRGRGRGKGINRAAGPKREIKREDLDKELDQYMANTRTDGMDIL